MSKEIVSPKLDIIFKMLFVRNKDLLRDFVSCMLDIPAESVKSLRIINSEMVPDSPNGKFSRLDLTMLVDKRLVNVEIQLHYDRCYRDRALFYWAKVFTSPLKRGEKYGKLKQTITLNIVDFNIFDDPDYHTEVEAVIRKTGEVLSDKFKIHFFELKKVGRKIDVNDRKKLWLQFLNAKSEEDLNMIKRTRFPIIMKAIDLLSELSDDPVVREKAWIREKRLHDEASIIDSAVYRGRKEGRAELIAGLKSIGISDEQIKAALAATKKQGFKHEKGRQNSID